MNEVELFLKLLDEKAVDKLLKTFNQNVKSDNLSLKKLKLKKTFRGLSNNPKGNKCNMSPFDFAVYKYSNKNFSNLDAMEMFDLFSRDTEEKIPGYIKMANAIYYHRKYTQEKLDRILENYNNNNNLFENILTFSSNEEVEKFLCKDKKCSIQIKNYIIEYLLIELDEESKQKLDELREIVSSWTLVDYQNNFTGFMKEYPSYLIEMAYLEKHQNKVEIENGIALDMIFNYYCDKKNILKEETNRNEIKKVEEQIKQLDNQIADLEKDNNNLEEKNINLVKSNKLLKKQVEQKINEFNGIKGKAYNYEKELKYKSNKIRELKDKISGLQDAILKNDNMEKQILLLKEQNKKLILDSNILNNKMDYMNYYLEYACSTVENKEVNYIFAIITASNVEICKRLFPEVLFININNLEKELCEKKALNINKIYIQRNGIASSKIDFIEKFSKHNNIDTKIIMSSNEKELIEKIVKIKIEK